MNSAIVVYCTFPNEEKALEIAKLLIDTQLAACVNVLPGLTSIYTWQGETLSAKECLLMIKTKAEIYTKLEKLIKENHPYDCPEIIGLPIEHGLKGYLQWIENSVSA